MMRLRIKSLLLVFIFTASVVYLFAQKGQGQNPGLSNAIVSPAPVTPETEVVVLSFYIGNNGNGVIDGSKSNNRIEFEISLSKLKPADLNNINTNFFGSAANDFDYRYDAAKNKLYGLQKSSVKFVPFELKEIKVQTAMENKTGLSTNINIGAEINLITTKETDDISPDDNKIFTYTYVTDKLLTGGIKAPKISPTDKLKITNEFTLRRLAVSNNILMISSDTFQVDFYDNAQIDGDSISVFFNGELIATRQKLGSNPIHFNLVIDTTMAVNEISMFANNLGNIPPNTALMILTDGTEKYKVLLSSSFETNGTIRVTRRRK